jgi:hypothetical protein
MSAAVAAVGLLWFSSTISATGLVAQIATGVVTYALAFRALYWSRFGELRLLISRARGQS